MVCAADNAFINRVYTYVTSYHQLGNDLTL